MAEPDVVEETPTEENPPQDNEPLHPLKGIVFVIVVVVFLIFLAKEVVLPALKPTDHAPTRVIDETRDGGYFEDFIGK